MGGSTTGHRPDCTNSPEGTMKTFDQQDLLPCLPVPELKDTCGKFLDWMAPLLSEDEWKETLQAVSDFTLEDGDGEKLQKKLSEWSCGEEICNWLEPFWYSHYLKDRLPIVINSNVFFMLLDKAPSASLTQSERAADIVDAVLRFQEMIVAENLPCDREKDCPLCMSQFSRIFSTARVPEVGQDRLRTPCCSEGPTPYRADNIIIIRQGHIFTLKVMDESGYVKSPKLIRRTLDRILSSHLAPLSDGECVGALTSMNRDEWAEVRVKLIESDSSNLSLLREIEDALCVICFDDIVPASRGEASRIMLHGDARNRWYDKSIEFIVCRDGTAAINYEHSSIDGSSVVSLTGFIYEHKTVAGKENERPDGILDYKELKFVLSPEIKAAIKKACIDFDAFAKDTSVRVLDFMHFGKDRIKTFKLSPDGFVQMGIQLASYKLWGKPCTSYEPVATRRFLHGRTEAMRPVTRESVEFTFKMMDPALSDEEKADALRAAVKKHVSRMKECKEGRGVDRHLLGLKNMYYLFGKELGISGLPSLFRSPGYIRLCHNTVSTSTSGHAGLSLCGFGPVVNDGFGVRYLTKPDQLNINLSSRAVMEEKLDKFTAYLEESYLEMADLMERIK